MKLFAKIFLIFTLVVIAAWKGPWLFNTFVSDVESAPFAMYSCVDEDFIYMDYDEERGVLRYDRKGNNFTLEETDSLLPMFFARQLIADGRFPDTIKGVAVTPETVREASFMFSAKAADCNTPHVGLYPLLESMPRRVSLEMPDDVMRFTDSGVEFVVMEENAVDVEKSRRFTEAMAVKGMQFPVKVACGNATTEKDYDDGYLLIDAANNLFNLKMMKGRPYVRHIELPDGVKPVRAWLTEFPDRKFLGFMADADNNLWLIMHEGSVPYRTGVTDYNCLEDNLAIYGNLFDWTVVVGKPGAQIYYAIDANDYSCIDRQDEPDNGYRMPGLSFTSRTDPSVAVRF